MSLLYEYTKWYRVKDDYGGLECIGDMEPDYKQYFPPEPKPRYDFRVQHYDGHILIDSKDYEGSCALFENCLAFRMGDCQNRIHPLYGYF
ncbi:MAG TPA: hypothetical protein VIO11_02440 [Candidatus Methanoperedens sp.]